MGGTIILWQALRSDQIGLYPEYTGTIGEEILKTSPATTAAEMQAELAKFGVGMTGELGFNNTYALVMQRAVAERKQIRRISDLRNHPELKLGLTHEFLNRRDGWRPLSEKYQLLSQNVVGIDHGLGYEALRNGSIDVKDAYSTDAKIGENDLITLEDDLQFFPQIQGGFALPPLPAAQRHRPLAQPGRNSQRTRHDQAERRSGADEKLRARGRAVFCGERLRSITGASVNHFATSSGAGRRVICSLSGISLLLAILVGIPLGIAASRGGPLGQVILGSPAPCKRFHPWPCSRSSCRFRFLESALALPSPRFSFTDCFPIVRNTATGLQDIAQPVRESAIALGLEPFARLWKIYLPIASRSILGGIKTSAVINIGTATLAALIGAGGLGEPILSGLNLNDHVTILQGAIPAAVLALLVQWSFDLLDRLLIPKGLRL